MGAKFDENCLKQNIFNYGNVVNLFTVYELGTWSYGADFRLGDCLISQGNAMDMVSDLIHVECFHFRIVNLAKILWFLVLEIV